MGLGRIEASECARFLLALRYAQTLRPCQSYQYSSVPTRRVHTADPRSVFAATALFAQTSYRKARSIAVRSACVNTITASAELYLFPIVCLRQLCLARASQSMNACMGFRLLRAG